MLAYPTILTIVHCDGTFIPSLYNMGLNDLVRFYAALCLVNDIERNDM